jgi:FkbM family methyltransferase
MEVYAEGDLYISTQIAETGQWESFETALVQRLLRPGDVFLDIGANIGWYTLIAATIVGPTGRVHAFEPSHENFALLRRNVAHNRLRNVVLKNAAVADVSGRGTLFLSPDNLGDHRLYQSAQERPAEPVQTVSLADYFSKRSDKVRLIKLDTQGSEARIFAGMPANFMAEREIAALIIEYWPYGLAESGSGADA